MNVENLKLLRDFLATVPAKRIDMGDFFRRVGDADDPTAFSTTDGVCNLITDCGTVGCIAGWSTSMFHSDRKFEWLDMGDVAKLDLGLTDEEAGLLFYMANSRGHCISHPDHGKRVVLAVLDIAIETGEVDWAAAFERCDKVSP